MTAPAWAFKVAKVLRQAARRMREVFMSGALRK
jgi:hypothetical protein